MKLNESCSRSTSFMNCSTKYVPERTLNSCTQKCKLYFLISTFVNVIRLYLVDFYQKISL